MIEVINEIWKHVIGYEGLYQVSNMGRVKSIDRTLYITRNGTLQTSERKGLLLSQEKMKDGYLRVKLLKNNIARNFLTHILVAKAFIDANFTYPQFEVNHKDCKKDNNHSSNLEITTKSENVTHAYKNNLIPKRKGESNPIAKISLEIASQIRMEYSTGNYTMTELANIHNLKSPTTISNIINNKQWVQ